MIIYKKDSMRRKKKVIVVIVGDEFNQYIIQYEKRHITIKCK